jgi:U1 small nuclear ribonucleoprotein
MKIFREKQGWLLTAIFTMLMAIALPATTFGHDHGKSNKGRHRDKKCAKFVNCHDARDGRVDGRGPRQGRLDDLIRNRRRHRNHDNDSNDLVSRNQRRHRDRDLDDDHSLRNGRNREREHDRDVDNDSQRHRRGKRHDDNDDNR